MNIRYKLTDKNMYTYNNTQWVLNEPKSVPGEGKLCSSGWIHVYTSPELAILLNPVHANFKEPRLFKVQCEGSFKLDRGLKEGWQTVTLIEELKIPTYTTNQHIAFAILCAKEVYKEPSWVLWADNWLNNIDRSIVSASSYSPQHRRHPVVVAAVAASYATNAAIAAAHAAAANAAATAIYAADNAADNAVIDFQSLAIKAKKYVD